MGILHKYLTVKVHWYVLLFLYKSRYHLSWNNVSKIDGPQVSRDYNYLSTCRTLGEVGSKLFIWLGQGHVI